MKLENCPMCIIVACAVLHNIAIELQEMFVEPHEGAEDFADPTNHIDNNAHGNAVCHSVVEQYF